MNMLWMTLGIVGSLGIVLAVLVLFAIRRRNAAAKTLAEITSGERFREVLDNAPYAIIVLRRDGIMEFANQTAVELFRADSADQFVGIDHLVLLHPDHHEIALSRRDDVLRGGIVPFATRRRIRFDDSEFISESRISSCIWNGENAVMIVSRDISDRIKAEEALVESEDLFRIVFENTGAGIFVRNLKNGTRQFNKAMCTLMGYFADELQAMRFRDIVYPDDWEKGPAITDKIMAGELDVSQSEARYIHKSGRVVWAVLNQTLIRDAEQNPVSIISVFQDISDLKQAELELKRSEERFRDVAESISDWMWEMGPDLRYTYISARVVEFIGFPVEYFLGKSQNDFGQPVGNRGDWDQLQEDLEAHRPFRDYSFERIGADGRSCHVSLSAKPLFDDKGEFLGYRGTGRDITARIEAEREAIRSEERFRYAIENSSESFALFDADEKLVVYNTKFRENSSLGPQFLTIGLSFEERVTALAENGHLIGVDDQNKTEWINRRLAQFRDRTEFPEYQLSNGRWRQAQYDGLADGSTIVRYIDITDQKQQQDALRASEERYALAIAATADGIWERNFLTGEVHRSARFLQILGFEPGDLEPNVEAFFDLLPPDDAERFRIAWQVHIETRAPFNADWEYRIRRKSGEYIWIRANAQAEWDENGVPVRLAGSIHDISENKQAEKDLIESESRFRSLADAASDWFWETDENFCLSWLSFDKHPIFGTPSSVLIGHRMWSQAVELDDPQAWNEQVDKFLEDRQPFRNILLRATTPNVGARTISVSGFPIFDENGTFRGYRGATNDVTRQLSTEEQLRQAQKMEAVGQLTGGIAHEFNNLLMVIVGNIEVLKLKLSHDPSLAEFATSALKGAMRGAELTQSLLAFSRKQTLAVTPIELNELVLRMHHMFQRTLGETFTLETDLADELSQCLADGGQIEGAMLNLLLNARDAMNEGGTIIIRTSNRVLSNGVATNTGADSGDYIALEIVDTGHGMTAEIIDQAFEPFFTTKDVGEGTGLGLSSVYGFAKQSGGFVEIDSEVGRGTTVRLCLPQVMRGDDVTREEVAVQENFIDHRAIILVVEDDSEVRSMVVDHLTSLGCEPIEAEDGQTALICLNERTDIELLFTDVVLPRGMNGQRLAMEARRMQPGIKIMFTSGYPDREFGDLTVNGELPVILPKPYLIGQLAEKLSLVLSP